MTEKQYKKKTKKVYEITKNMNLSDVQILGLKFALNQEHIQYYEKNECTKAEKQMQMVLIEQNKCIMDCLEAKTKEDAKEKFKKVRKTFEEEQRLNDIIIIENGIVTRGT